MLPAERLTNIVNYLDSRGSADIQELMRVFQVSKPTILRDLKKLEEEHQINRTFGGATSIKRGTKFEQFFNLKANEFFSEKQAIASQAQKLIFPGETILLDSGSTTLELAKNILNIKNISIITNDLKIASLVADHSDNELIVLGGKKREHVYSLLGTFTEGFLKMLKVDKTFLGVDAIDVSQGLTNANLEEINIKRLMIEAGKEVILLADSSKFDNVALGKIDDVTTLNTIITDTGVSSDNIVYLEENDIEVLTVEAHHNP